MKQLGLALLFFLSTTAAAVEIPPELAIVIPAAEAELGRTPGLPATKAAIKESFALQKENKFAEAIERLSREMPTAEGVQKGRLVYFSGYRKLAQEDYDGAEAEFHRIARGEVPAAEFGYADARVRLAYIKLRRKDREGAREEFLKIARGTVKADAAIATDAGLRAAAISRLMGKHTDARALWEQVAEQAPKTDDRLYAKLQIAGLLWETGKGDYGKPATKAEANAIFQESMAVCREIIDHPDAIPETRATAELIFLEGYYFQGDFATAGILAKNHVEKWMAWSADNPDSAKKGWNPDRQILTAQTWLCFCQYRTAQYEECIASARLIRSGVWDEGIAYKNFNCFGYSLL